MIRIHRWMNRCGLLLFGLLTGALGSACAGAPVQDARGTFIEAREAAAAPEAQDNSARRAAAAAALEALLEPEDMGTGEAPRDPEQTFWASYFLAQLHTSAADEPFLTEPSMRREHVGSIHITNEQRAKLDDGLRYSRTAHLVAALDHAGRARRLALEFDEAPRPPAELQSDSVNRGEAPPPPGLEALETNLALLMATSYARLGFRREVGLALEAAPRLLEPDSCVAFMEEFEVRGEMRPWVCDMVAVHLRAESELLAYRFAVMAIEGESRFGHALPGEEVAELEAWILNGAQMRFVCPRSQTGYIPGRERSPLSGIRHIEYVAVAR